jgi:hypothetical protein
MGTMNNENKGTGVSGESEACEERARKTRDSQSREWQMTLARTYRMLAEAASDNLARRQQQAA